MAGTAVGLVTLRRRMDTVGIMAGVRMDMGGITTVIDTTMVGTTMVMAGIMVGTGVIIITTITAIIEGIEIETGIEELYQVATTPEVTV